jgi:DNA polymerase-1
MSKTHKEKFVIIDAMSLAYKAYYAFVGRPLKTMQGEPTSAVFGFIGQLLKIIEDLSPDRIAVAFDSKEKTFRHTKFEDYKANRQAIPDDLIPQIQRIKDIIEAFNIPIYILPGYEADDLIGSAAKKAELLGFDTYVITPDKDFSQLISDSIKIIRPGKSAEDLHTLDKDKFKEKYGFAPPLMIDYLALVGDASDNIPGVAGIGEKSAIPLIQQFGTVEEIYKNIDKVGKEAIKKKLLEGKDNAFLSKELATIEVNAPYEMDFEKTKRCNPDLEKVNRILTELEFKNFKTRVAKLFISAEITSGPEVTPSAELKETYQTSNAKYTLISDIEAAKELAKKLKKCGLFVFDTETDGLDVLTLNLAGVSFSTAAKEGYYVSINPFKEDSLFNPALSERINIDDFVYIFKGIFEDKKIKKVCQNAKYDIAVMNKYGIEVENFFFDTMLASYVLDPDQKHGMDDLCVKYLNYDTIKLEEIIGPKKNADKIFEADLQALCNYSSEDADVTYRLYEIFVKEIEKNNLAKVAYEVEFPLIKTLIEMEKTGINVDPAILKQLSKDLQILIDNYSAKICELAEEEFNINSPQQLQRILYDKLKLSAGKKTKTGFSTDARSLEYLRGEHEIIDLILDYRQAAKLKSTYADALPNMIHPITKRIHTNFNQTIAATGRLSSTDPNLQNIPIRSEMGKEIRKAFIPRNKDYVILSADYSQIELRILAAICKDPNLVKAFKNGDDIHRSAAAAVFNVPPEQVTPDMRRKAKEVNFGILYGLGPFGLKTRLGITQAHAKEIIEAYFKSYVNVKEYIENSIESARSKGYAETLLGRRRYLRNINNNNRVVRQFEERAAINMPIQGAAADMIKIAMINIHEEFAKKKFKSKMVLQVHDELLFDAHKSELDDIKPIIKEKMEKALNLDVPIVADIGIGDNWLDAH